MYTNVNFVENFGGNFLAKSGHIRGKKRQWLGNFSEQRDLHFFSVKKDFLKLEKIWDRSMEPFFEFWSLIFFYLRFCTQVFTVFH